MLSAIEAMKLSVDEPRKDGKASPKVGAILVKPDGTIESAHRGELRHGDHAEFTLIERKNRENLLDGSVIFATLEPCAKGSRSLQKLSCAEHIVNARIKAVYVGVEDDNPTVAGKGIEYLKRNNIEVKMFDRDLQDIIHQENKSFFEWARKQNDQKKEAPIKLSKYEDSIPTIYFDDLSTKALTLYKKKIVDHADAAFDFNRLLCKQGLLTENDGKFTPTGYGYLLFGKQPRNSMPQAGVMARVELPNGKSTREEFDKAMVLIPNLLEEWLNKIQPSTLDRSQSERIEQVDLPFEIIREAVVNALVHRDYDIQGQKCQLSIDEDTIIIKSPGGPVHPITMEQMRSFSVPIKSRNPILHFVFNRMGLAEEQGFGLTSLKEHTQELGLPLPTFSMEGDYLVLTIYRSKTAALSSLDPVVLKDMNKSERSGWEWVVTQSSITSSEYATAMEIPSRTALNHLKHFVTLGILEKIGSGKATHYEVLK